MIKQEYFEINSQKFLISTPINLFEAIYSFCRSEFVTKGSLRSEIVSMLPYFVEMNDKIEEFSRLFNLNENYFKQILKKDFHNYHNFEKNERQPSDKEKKKEEHSKNWIISHTFTHNQYQYICNKHLWTMYNIYSTECKKDELLSGFKIFSKTWKNLNVKMSKHGNMDLYSCCKCHGNRLKQLQDISNRYNKNKFPYHKKEIESILNLKISNFRIKKRLIQSAFYETTGYFMNNIIFNSIFENIINVQDAWKVFDRSLIELKNHRTIKAMQFKKYLIHKRLSDTYNNHFLVLLDYGAHKTNNQKNVVVLMIPVLHNNQITYHKFCQPQNYSFKKSNFTYHCIKKLVDQLSLKDGITYFHFWSDNCSGDFIQNDLFYYVSQLCNEKTEIKWNSFEVYHGHSIADCQLANEIRSIKKALLIIDGGEDYDENFVKENMKKTKNTKFYEEDVPNYFDKTFKNINGISFAHQWCFPKPGYVVFRLLSEYKGFLENKSKQYPASKKKKISEMDVFKDPRLVNYKDETIFEWQEKKINIENKKKKKKKEREKPIKNNQTISIKN